MDINLYELTFGLFEKLASLAEAGYEFLFTELNFLGIIKISVWQMLAGGGFIVLMVAFLIKKFI